METSELWKGAEGKKNDHASVLALLGVCLLVRIIAPATRIPTSVAGAGWRGLGISSCSFLGFGQ